MKAIASKPGNLTIQQAIQEAEKEIQRFVDAETDPILRAILKNRIDLSVSNLADSIEKNYLEGSVISGDDGSIDTLQSTIETDFLEYLKRVLEETKMNYLSKFTVAKDPANIPIIHANKIITLFSIKEEWELWAMKQQLLADEAIPLMNGVDPTSWKEYKNGVKGLPDTMAFSIERGLIMAKAKGFVISTPSEWLAWGRNHDLNKPVLKSNEVLNEPDVCMFYLFESAVKKISDSLNTNPKVKIKEADWKKIALTKADRIYKTMKEIGTDPSKMTIADKIADEFVKEGIRTIKGKRLNSNYILRHALNKWNRPEV